MLKATVGQLHMCIELLYIMFHVHVWNHTPILFQLCAKSDITISLALKTSEKMYTETDGTSYLYYEGAEASDT